ncbi:AI-2E family transporter [Aliiglaciecola litoralis]|uniref:AI-2E family transporter n=1 Tax=Aliiglaciecola litoralis TaxID=582857 RepID=A0ABN1LCB8_9ALTE
MKENPLLHRRDDFKVKTRDIRAVRLLSVLVGLATLYTFYYAQTLLVPAVFSVLVALLLSPLVSRLETVHVPRTISSIVLLMLLVMPFSFLGAELSEPIQRWMKLIPQLSLQVTEHINEISDVFEEVEHKSLEDADKGSKTALETLIENDPRDQSNLTQQSAVEQKLKQSGVEVVASLLTGAPIFLAQLLGSFILILFLIIFGPPLFKVFINDFPIVKNKHRAKLLIKSIQHALSKYIATISLINSGLGIVTAMALAAFGVRDALLWGALVGLLNFVPYVGSVTSLAILCFVGFVQFGITAIAFLPSCIFLLLNIIESQIVTPAVLGNTMRVNPLIIIVWLLLSGWIWGVLGVLLAVPILVCIKLVIEQMEVFPHWLKLIEAKDDD